MNFLTLEYFVKIAKTQNISAVAKESYISQQALSERIHKLETELGAPLFRRTRPLELTQAGEILLEDAQEILAIRDKMTHDIGKIALSKKLYLTIGIASYLNPPFLSTLINQFIQKNADCEIVLRSVNPNRPNVNSEVDLLFVDSPNPSAMTVTPVTDNDFYAVMVEHKLLEHIYGQKLPDVIRQLKATRDLTLLKELPFIVPCDENRNICSFISTAFENAGFQPNIVFRSERHGLNIEMCLNGTGAYLGPSGYCFSSVETKLKNADSRHMFLVNIPNCSAPKLGLGYASDKEPNIMELKFIEATRQYLQELEERWMPPL